MNENTIISISAVVVAISALIVSIWQGLSNRKHNRLAVKPILVFYYWDVSDRPLSLVLKNVGVGPGVIKKAYFVIDGKKQVLTSFDFITQLSINNIDVCWNPSDHDTISPGDEWPILQFKNMECHSDERIEAIKKIQRVEYILEYESIYSDKSHIKYKIKSTSYPL